MENIHECLEHNGACVLPGFLTDRGVSVLANEARDLSDLAWPSPTAVTPYYGKFAEDFPNRHPRQTRQVSDMALVGDFNIPPDTAIRRLYEWAPLVRFLAEIVKAEQLYPFADPCQSVNLSVIDEGGQQPWHFDSGELTVTLLLQAPQGGGAFEYVPRLRDTSNENYEGVAEVLAGAHHRTRVATLEPGALFVFLGEHSLHRVTPVIGTKRRLIAIYLYDPTPGRRSVRSSNIRLYGPGAAEAMDAVGMREPATASQRVGDDVHSKR